MTQLNTSNLVLFELRGPRDAQIAIGTLNSEGSLNALTVEMIDALSKKLDEWEHDSTIVAVFLQGSGAKAFCAGGDIRKLHASMIEWRAQKNPDAPNPFADRFFTNEYTLDHKIHIYPKPLIVWGHGIVMGGGLGLMAGASFRVVTESSKVAMPEITIGLYPEVGATWFLTHLSPYCPKGTGLYLALTGTRLGASECLDVGLADVYIKAGCRDSLLNSLSTCLTQDNEKNFDIVSNLLKDLSKNSVQEVPLPPSQVSAHRSWIEQSTAHESLLDIKKFWDTHPAPSTWAKAGVETFAKGSPLSACVIFDQICKFGPKLSLREAFLFEWGLTVRFSRANDFAEGVRALIVDKDNSPKWEFDSIPATPQTRVDWHFQTPAFNPLHKIPTRAPRLRGPILTQGVHSS